MRLFIITVALGVLGLVLMRSGTADEKPAPPAGGQPTTQPAQPGQPGQPGQTRGPRFNAERFIKDHDKNNDGKLSKDELPAGVQDSFAEIDADKDGFITKEELQAHADRMASRRPRMIEVVFFTIDVPEPDANPAEELQRAYDVLRKLDINKDGKIDAKELANFRETRKKERCDAMFKHMDKDGDGKISKAEARGLWADNFDQLDLNKDGFLDRTEIEKAFASAAPAPAGKDRPQPQPQPQPQPNPPK